MSGGWLPVAPCTVDSCVAAPAELAGPLRRVARLVGAVVVVLAGLPCTWAARALGGSRADALAMAWSRTFLRVLGLRLEVRQGFTVLGGAAAPVRVVEEEPESAGALLVANHVSWLDPLVVAATTPCLALAKSEIAAWPLIRSLVAGSGAIFIHRERLSTLPGTVRAIADALRAGRSVVAFPEGTTWCGRGGGPFRRAVFQAAIDAGAPVRPITLRFRDRAGHLATGPSFVGEDTLLASLVRVVSAKGLVVEVTRFPLIPHTSGVDRRALAGLAHATVLGDHLRHDEHLAVAA
ncbi:lysophospholipid acyltransferase family protein [Sphaerisporangium rhizosphaerae]|uniref:Lysophospholipid acyltransferase family protein n=1 Tax=Sphaerisporangium rhizosphaerae TaxID=2269375 RepID=A0ABW2P946_9ACTN